MQVKRLSQHNNRGFRVYVKTSTTEVSTSILFIHTILTRKQLIHEQRYRCHPLCKIVLWNNVCNKGWYNLYLGLSINGVKTSQ